MITSSVADSLVSLERISEFLKSGELQEEAREVVKKQQLKRGDEVRTSALGI